MFAQRRIHILSLALAGALMLAGSAAAQVSTGGTCDFPLFIEQAGAEANVIFLFDSSGSMDIPVYHEDYNQFVTYPGVFKSNRDYYVGSDGLYEPRDFGWGLPTSPSALLVDSDVGEDGRYPGNYLNWIYFNADNQQRAEIPVVTRIQVAKGGVSQLIDETDGVRFGIWKFNSDNGGRIVTALTADKAQLQSDLSGIYGSGWTPLAESMEDILNDLKRTDGNAPIQYQCQKNFLIVVTDGYPTKDLNIANYLKDYDQDGKDPGTCSSMGSPDPNSNDCSDHMDDIAKYMFDNDLIDDGIMTGKQNVVTYSIGFALDANILQDTADNGGGLYFNANNAAELQQSLTNVLRDIISQLSSGTAVSVVSAENATGNKIFRAKFEPGSWNGEVEAFKLPFQTGDSPVWKAGQKLANKDPDTRKIYTSTSGTNRVVFKSTKLSNLQPTLNVQDSQEALDVIAWTRGSDITGARDRGGWKLGDIVNSSPVVVGAPAFFYDYLDYQSFRIANKDRIETLYIASNDGMVHALRTSNGNERFAYIPKANLPRLKDLMNRDYCHEFYTNATPRVADVHVGGVWKTLLIAGQREGGNSYFCLDITVPTAAGFRVMWDREYPEVTESWSVPEIVRDKSNDKYYAVVGTGPDPNGDAGMLILDLENGDIVRNESLSSHNALNMATDAVALDKDFDGYDDLMYISDLAGNVWRWDMASFPWTKSKLFSTNQPIQAKSIIGLDKDGKALLYFGTGQYIESPDVNDTSQQTFYHVIDNNDGNTVTRSNLIDQTYTITKPDPADRGWYLDLVQAAGERITRPDALAAGTVYFTSFAPSNAVCTAGGKAWLYTIDFEDGSNPDADDGSEDDNTDDRVTSLGDGIHSEPILDLANEDIILQSTDTTLRIEDTKGVILRVIVQSWRQMYN